MYAAFWFVNSTTSNKYIKILVSPVCRILIEISMGCVMYIYIYIPYYILT